MNYESERLRILEMIDKGLISASEGIQLLDALQGDDEDPSTYNESVVAQDQTAIQSEPEVAPQLEPVVVAEESPELAEESPVIETPSSDPYIDSSIDKWKRWWWIPMWIGITVTVISGVLMFFAWQSGGFGFWFACSWFPFLLGVGIMALAWGSRTARWLHVRVHQQPGEWPQKIAISLPLPLRLTAWFFRTFGRYIPNLEHTNIDEIIMALEHTSADTPIYVEVDEGDDGERVEVFIG